MPSESNDKPDPETSPAAKQAKSFSQQNAMVMELPFIFVGCIVVGGAIASLGRMASMSRTLPPMTSLRYPSFASDSRSSRNPSACWTRTA